ncbi:hypothetical protein N018_25205 [Pseudomonas syringae CC1557]|uniref:Uncharacterized protein n=1 Tax=Pseudomonas syringae CC1557 TaxID=1357279 RepID=W0N1K1_PSESX|nr:hypothetical protein [Pseudomonas syringae]AHG43350.1 hypothetical protein N018_25205 [Pseudomonas syringae CC1557]
MIAENDLLEEFGDVRRIRSDVFFFQDKMRTYTYNYWLQSSSAQDLLVVSENLKNDSLAIEIIDSAPSDLAGDKPTIYKLKKAFNGFTHGIAVPSEYHGYLKGTDGIDRRYLFLCLPIFRCEFSGNESPEEFRELRLHYNPTLDWERDKHPKIRVYFDNPKTGAGVVEDGVFFRLNALLNEINNLNGVSNGFIEITNWAGAVIEILSPEHDKYLLIRNREDEEEISKADLISLVNDFCCS